MAFADPISVTYNGVATNHVRAYQPNGPSLFKTSDDGYKVEVSHSTLKGRRERHFIRITQRKIAADPLTPATNVESTMSVYAVIDNPLTGFSDTEIGYVLKGLCDFLNVSANATKFIGGEA